MTKTEQRKSKRNSVELVVIVMLLGSRWKEEEPPAGLGPKSMIPFFAWAVHAPAACRPLASEVGELEGTANE